MGDDNKKRRPFPGKQPLSVSWRIDADYLDSLSEKDREWYEDFCHKYYGADFRDDKDWTPEERREAFTDRNRANSDLVTFPVELESGAWVASTTLRATYLERMAESPDRDMSESPSYLESEEYKQARADFRDLLYKGRGSRYPKKNKDFKKKKARLRAFINKEDNE